MLMESVTDPRRANWLTITSMSEDLCWPEDGSVSRPSWELEAEILRLTTRLMMRERELRQVKTQLKSQVTRTQQQAVSWRRRMDEKEEQMRLVLVQKDAEMQSIVSQLLLFEAELRQEQSRIEDLLQEKDSQIHRQQEEISRLQQQIQEASQESNHHDCDISNGVDHLHNVLEQSTLSNGTDCDIQINGVVHHHIQDRATEETAQIAVRKLRDGVNKIRAIQDVTNVRSAGDKLSIEAHDIFDYSLIEKKRVLHRTPQKMKDLKAKRFNSHKMHRPVVSDTCAQVIL